MNEVAKMFEWRGRGKEKKTEKVDKVDKIEGIIDPNL